LFSKTTARLPPWIIHVASATQERGRVYPTVRSMTCRRFRHVRVVIHPARYGRAAKSSALGPDRRSPRHLRRQGLRDLINDDASRDANDGNIGVRRTDRRNMRVQSKSRC
jgi:hypothetical protein